MPKANGQEELQAGRGAGRYQNHCSEPPWLASSKWKRENEHRLMVSSIFPLASTTNHSTEKGCYPGSNVREGSQSILPSLQTQRKVWSWERRDAPKVFRKHFLYDVFANTITECIFANEILIKTWAFYQDGWRYVGKLINIYRLK